MRKARVKNLKRQFVEEFDRYPRGPQMVRGEVVPSEVRRLKKLWTKSKGLANA